MLRKLADGLPTGEYSRQYPGPNFNLSALGPTAARTARSTPCVDRLSRVQSGLTAASTNRRGRLYGRCGLEGGGTATLDRVTTKTLPRGHRTLILCLLVT